LVDVTKPGVLTQVRPFVSYTYTDAEFKSYELGANNYRGKQVTGSFKNLFTGGLDVETQPGVYLNLTSYYTDKTPMSDNNARFAPAYWLFNSRLGIRNKRYVASVALNQATPVGRPTFYNPGMPRNWYAGANLSYTF
jgi:iron complex outermembrane receptor protein